MSNFVRYTIGEKLFVTSYVCLQLKSKFKGKMIEALSKIILFSVGIYTVHCSPVPGKLYESPNSFNNVADSHGSVTVHVMPKVDNTGSFAVPWGSAIREISPNAKISSPSGKYISSMKKFVNPKQFVERATIGRQSNAMGVDRSQIQCRFFADGVNIGPVVKCEQVVAINEKVDGITCTGFLPNAGTYDAGTAGFNDAGDAYDLAGLPENDNGDYYPYDVQKNDVGVTDDYQYKERSSSRGTDNYLNGIPYGHQQDLDGSRQDEFNDYDVKDSGSGNIYNSEPSHDYDYSKGSGPGDTYNNDGLSEGGYLNNDGTSSYDNNGSDEIFENKNSWEDDDSVQNIDIYDNYSAGSPYDEGSFDTGTDFY